MAIKKSPEPNALYVLAELEKQVERRNSLRGKGFRDVSDLIAHKKMLRRLKEGQRFPQLRKNTNRYSKFKVVNCFRVKNTETNKIEKTQHGRAQNKYNLVIDAKHIKMLVKRSYRSKRLFEFFKSLFQFLNRTLIELDSSNSEISFDADFVKKKLNLSSFGIQTMNTYASSHKNRVREIIKQFDSLYK